MSNKLRTEHYDFRIRKELVSAVLDEDYNDISGEDARLVKSWRASQLRNLPQHYTSRFMIKPSEPVCSSKSLKKTCDITGETAEFCDIALYFTPIEN